MVRRLIGRETIENNNNDDSHEDMVEVGLAVFRSFEEVVDVRLQSSIASLPAAESPEPDDRRPSRKSTPELKVRSTDLIASKLVATVGIQLGHTSAATASPSK